MHSSLIDPLVESETDGQEFNSKAGCVRVFVQSHVRLKTRNVYEFFKHPRNVHRKEHFQTHKSINENDFRAAPS